MHYLYSLFSCMWMDEWQQGRFEQMSDTILSKIDEMDKRLDDLEGTMHTLASQSGVSLPPPPVRPSLQLPFVAPPALRVAASSSALFSHTHRTRV
jgi:hypothetical protein